MHVGYIGHIPLTDIAIKLAVKEHIVHVGYVGYIPLADVTIEFTSFEQFAHIGETRDIDVVQVTFGPKPINFFINKMSHNFFFIEIGCC